MKPHWILLALMTVTAVSCGKPKPREVTELRLDDKPVELKAEPLKDLAAQMNTLCDLADFMQSQARARAAAGQVSVVETINPSGAPSTGAAKERAALSVSTEQTAFGDKVVSTTRTAMGLNESLATHLKEFADATPGKRVASQPLQAIQSTLDAARSGWRVATLYRSDTAPEASLAAFERYTYRKVTLRPSRVECEEQTAQSVKPRR
jgi:hypothetical protein